MSDTRPVSFTELLDWVEGRLPADRLAAVEASVQDEEAGRSVAWIRAFLDAGRLMPLATPPEPTRRRLRDLIAERTTPWEPSAYSDGSLVFDSRHGARAAGTRSGDHAAGELLDWIFDTDFGRVHVSVAPAGPVTPVPGEPPAPAGWMDVADRRALDVRGRVDPLRPDDEASSDLGAVEVLLVADQRVRASAVCDPTGRFEMSCSYGTIDEIWLRDAHQHVRLSVPASPASAT
jgi:hypothetical protein